MKKKKRNARFYKDEKPSMASRVTRWALWFIAIGMFLPLYARAAGVEHAPLTLRGSLPSGMRVDDFYILAAACAAGLAVFAIGTSLFERDRMAHRLKSLAARRVELQSGLTKSRKRHKPEGSVNLMRGVVNKFHMLKSSQVTQVQSILTEAGFRSKDAIVVYMFFTLIMPFIGLGVGFLLYSMHWEGKMHVFRIVFPVLMTYIGLKLPMWFIKHFRKKRYYGIQKALADTLDLMTICAEAGLSLAASLERVSRELGLAYPEMAEELALTAMELGFLPDRKRALLNLTERVKMPEIRGIISVLIQTEKYGTPIAQAMRVLSSEFREQRMLRAENKAAKLPALMTVPMILFILPTLFIVIIAPAAIKVMTMTAK